MTLVHNEFVGEQRPYPNPNPVMKHVLVDMDVYTHAVHPMGNDHCLHYMALEDV